MRQSTHSISDEADLIARYLIGRSPNDRIKRRYEDAMHMLHYDLDAVDRRLWEIVTCCPFTFRLIDGGLAILRPASSIRRKVHVMLAVLEASPEYCEYFLPKGFGLLYGLSIVVTGARAVFAGVIGYAALKLMGIKGQ